MTNPKVKTLFDARNEAARQAQKSREEIAFRVFFNQNPELACDANKSIFRDFIGEEAITTDSLYEALPHLEGRLAVKTPAKVEADAIDSAEQQREELSEMSVEQ